MIIYEPYMIIHGVYIIVYDHIWSICYCLRVSTKRMIIRIAVHAHSPGGEKQVKIRRTMSRALDDVQRVPTDNTNATPTTAENMYVPPAASELSTSIDMDEL